MTAEKTLQNAIVAASGIPAWDANRILRFAIIDAFPMIKTEVLDAFHEGETSGFASGSLNGFEQGVDHG